MTDGTPSSEIVPGWYRQLWLDVLSQLPKPEEVTQEIAEGWHVNRSALRKGLFEFLVLPATAVAETVAKTVKLLQHLRDVALGPISEFKAAEKFTKSNSEAKLCDFGGNFKKVFLNLVEAPVSAATVSVSELLNNSLDAPIRTELGDGHVITLGQFYEMLKVLPKDGTWFIAYIIGNDGNVWAVDARWDSFREGWDVGACSVGARREWCAGDQVLSRKSRV